MSSRPPCRPDDLFRLLAEIGVDTETVHHPPVLTMAESRAVRGDVSGTACKNLLLRDRAGALYLVVAAEDRRLDLKALAAALGATRLSFAAPAELARALGVGAGTATPFAVLNDRGGTIRVVIERALLSAARLGFHPLANTMTTAIAPADLLRFLAATQHPPVLVD
jgi:Ala-tRNA(Pro) deacylase